jgi:hypothetical protein
MPSHEQRVESASADDDEAAIAAGFEAVLDAERIS